MKDLRHIKLFEAFESSILPKTLGYINNSSRSTFMEYIKKICNVIDFPLSELSDDYLEYLPFSAALKKADIITDEPCDATSGQAFPEYEVKGEVCNKGTLKRKWGSRVRSVTCPVCGGTGVKPKVGEPKLIKFWFTSEGDYVDVTCVDGVIRPSGREGTIVNRLSERDSDYVVVKTLNDREVQRLQTGSLVKISIGEYKDLTTYAYIVNRGGSVYAIQNVADGSGPSGYNGIARYSWAINGGEYRDAILVNRVTEEDKTSVPDPYDWNTGFQFSHRGMAARRTNIEPNIKRAHFAIVMDFAKLKKSEYNKAKDIKVGRQESKQGALSFMSDDEIKKANVNRYLTKIAAGLDISDITNLNKVVKRIIGVNSTIYNIRSGYAKDYISNIIGSYMEIFKASDDRKELYIKELNDNIRDYFKTMSVRNTNINTNLTTIKKRLSLDGNREDELKIISLLEILNKDAYNVLTNVKIETIEDLEVIYQKSLAIKNIMTVRRYGLDKLSQVMDYMNRNDEHHSYQYLTDHYYIRDYKDQIITGLETAIKIVKKL